MAASSSASSDLAMNSPEAENAFQSYYTEVKEIEKRDSVLTPKQQIERLLRPGATYFNLNPFEVVYHSDHCETNAAASNEGPSTLPCKLTHCHFSAQLMDTLVHFSILGMRESFFVWIGSTPHLKHLSMAVNTRFDAMPLTSSLLGSQDSDNTLAANGLALRLAKRTGKTVWVSLSLPQTQHGQLVQQAERVLCQELKHNPNKLFPPATS